MILMGGVGFGITYLCSALAHKARLRGHSELFAKAVDIINTLTAAQIAPTPGGWPHQTPFPCACCGIFKLP